jgi:hypothetical protein
MATYRAYARPAPGRPHRAAEVDTRRSHAAIPVVVVLVLVGLYVGRFSVLFPGLLGLGLFWTGGSFLSTRVNPLSPHFYLTRKPSWTAIGVVFLGAAVLFGIAYAMWTHGLGPVIPRL